MADYFLAKRKDGLLEASAETGCDNLTIITADEETTLAANGKQIHVVCAWKMAA